VKTAASTLRQNPEIDTETAITQLAVGEALVSFLDAKGTPSVVERAWILPPASRIGPVTPAERKALITRSTLAGRYEQTVDRESAFEKLAARTNERQPAQPPSVPPPAPGATAPSQGAPSLLPPELKEALFGRTGPRGGHYDGLVQAAAKSAARTMGSSVGREILRGVLGSVFGGRR
jgi:DNA helicase HerA-like ATPase